MSDKVTLTVDLEKGDLDKPFNEIEKKAKQSGKEVGKQISDGAESAVKSFLKTASIVTGAIGAIAGAFTFREAIRAAQEQEDAINRLNGALIASGTFSQATSQSFIDFADNIERTSKVTAEAVLESIALTRSLTNLDNNGIKRATQASLDLSSALGISLDSATRLVTRAANGQVEALSRYGITVQKGKDDTETFANALALLESRFGGRAAQEVNTFSGALFQLEGRFGDIIKSIGTYITTNPFIIAGIGKLAGAFAEAAKQLEDFFKTLDFFNDIISPLLNFNDAVINFVVAPLELLFNVGKSVFQSLELIFAGFVANIGRLGAGLASALSFAGIETQAVENLRNFAETSNQVLLEAKEKYNQTDLFDFGVSAKLATQNEELRAGLSNFNATLQEKNLESQGLVDQNKTILTQAANNTTDAAKQAAAAPQKLATDANRVINQGLARTVSGGIQSIANSLIQGENVFANFSAFVLGAFGDLAIQLGEFYIAQGLANLALLAVEPSGLIAAGAGLVALGTILKSFGSKPLGASGAGASATGGTTSGFDQSDLADLPRDLQREEKDPTVQVTIQGNVFDSEETGTSIAKILSDAFGKQGITLTDPRFA